MTPKITSKELSLFPSEHFPELYLLDSYDEPLYFETIEDAAKCVADIVGHPIEPSAEAIDQALDDYLD